MIAHVVLFRPRAGLPGPERERLADAFSIAVAEIGSIRRVRVGRRITHGRGYEALMTTDYSHMAIFEFDDVTALESYLRHPAHEALAARFFAAFEVALMYDFDLLEGKDAPRLLAQ
jgi:hypothetical protein